MKEKKAAGKSRMREGNIALILDDYDDIFSDFDPRPYADRAISDDFMNECRKAARNKNVWELELRLLVPQARRNQGEETTIKHRLRSYFKKHQEQKEQEIKAIRRQGGLWLVIGAICMLVGTFLYTSSARGILGLAGTSFFYQLLIVIFEPAGWFFVWEGMDKILMGSKEQERDLAFHRKMALAHIEFSEY